MSGKTDQIKGRIKEAAGVLTDNDRLKRKGKFDQVVGKVKETAENAVDKMKESLKQQTPRPGQIAHSRSAAIPSAESSEVSASHKTITKR
jgi:uncharacterized protein YjbJ (UPF0337 family)